MWPEVVCTWYKSGLVICVIVTGIHFSGQDIFTFKKSSDANYLPIYFIFHKGYEFWDNSLFKEHQCQGKFDTENNNSIAHQ